MSLYRVHKHQRNMRLHLLGMLGPFPHQCQARRFQSAGLHAEASLCLPIAYPAMTVGTSKGYRGQVLPAKSHGVCSKRLLLSSACATP